MSSRLSTLPTASMTPADVHAACESLTIAEIEAIEAGLVRQIQKRTDANLPLQGAGDHLALIREELAMRRAEEG